MVISVLITLRSLSRDCNPKLHTHITHSLVAPERLPLTFQNQHSKLKSSISLQLQIHLPSLLLGTLQGAGHVFLYLHSQWPLSGFSPQSHTLEMCLPCFSSLPHSLPSLDISSWGLSCFLGVRCFVSCLPTPLSPHCFIHHCGL